jgi:hypothetical protein
MPTAILRRTTQVLLYSFKHSNGITVTQNMVSLQNYSELRSYTASGRSQSISFTSAGPQNVRNPPLNLVPGFGSSLMAVTCLVTIYTYAHRKMWHLKTLCIYFTLPAFSQNYRSSVYYGQLLPICINTKRRGIRTGYSGLQPFALRTLFTNDGRSYRCRTVTRSSGLNLRRLISPKVSIRLNKREVPRRQGCPCTQVK